MIFKVKKESLSKNNSKKKPPSTYVHEIQTEPEKQCSF
jgi:hypothetical protein